MRYNKCVIYWKNLRKIVFLCYISSNFLASKNVGKSSILLISSKFLFCFWTSQPQNVIGLRWIPCLHFFWQANDLRCNGGVWFQPSCSYKKIMGKKLLPPGSAKKVKSKSEHLCPYNIVIQDVKLMI